MAAKDLQIAGKDLQIVRTRQAPIPESPSSFSSADRSAAATPTVLLLEILRRQWLLLILAGTAAGTVAYFYSVVFATAEVTAHLQLQSRSLPLAGSDVYVTPSADTVAELVTSNDVLQPVVEKYNLPSVRILSRFIYVKADARTGSLDIELTLQEMSKVIAVLDEIGNSVTAVVSRNRDEMLETHAKYIRTLLVEATNELDAARAALVREHSLSQSRPGNNVIQTAELQGLVSQRGQLESELQASVRRTARNVREMTSLRRRQASLLAVQLSAILDARRKQIDAFGRGLTSATKSVALKSEMQAQLDTLALALEKEFAPVLIDRQPANAAGIVTDKILSGAEGVADDTESAVASDQPSFPEDEPSSATPALTSAELQPSPGEVFVNWVTRIQDIGSSVAGRPDPATQELIRAAHSELAALETTNRVLRAEQSDLEADRSYFETALADIRQQISQFPLRQEKPSLMSAALMQAESRVAQMEDGCASLSQLVSRIEQIQKCRISEYFVSQRASYDVAGDLNSNRKMLFVVSLLISGIVFVSPALLLEWRRLRPSPVDVFSRRWHLPALGIQAGRTLKRTDSVQDVNRLRLMALRIQQGLFQPTGRVVLFSGLDHDESPLGLIRELSRCLSQREETVLIMQTLPCQLELAKKSGRNNERCGRPGVAEFLAGEVDNVADLVTSTGITGIDFVPGGCTVTASESMASSRLTALIDECRSQYSMILMCGPSTLHPADLQMLAARADGIVFTVNKQSLHAVYGEEVIGDLIELGASILGFAEQPVRGKHSVPAVATASSDFLTESPVIN